MEKRTGGIMKITNKTGLPQIIVNAVTGKERNYDDKTFSVTEILNPVRQIVLKRRYSELISEDVTDRIWSLLGTAVHYIVQENETEDVLVEERLSHVFKNGYTLTGAFDIFDGTTLWDLKTTSAWTIIYNSRIDDWTQQQNSYRLLLHYAGFEAEELKIIAILRDWSKTKAMSADYPSSQVKIITLKTWEHEKTESFINQRLALIAEGFEKYDCDLPLCTEEERWASPSKYAIMKEGRKSAVRLHTSMESAEEHLMSLDNKHSIQVRQGVDKRCVDYCSCCAYCDYWLEHYGNE